MTGIAGYEIYRGPTLVGTTDRARRSRTRALTAAGSQSYTVKAIDGAGNASAATPAKAVVYDNVAPGAPGKPTDPEPSAAPALQLGGGHRHRRLEHRALRRLPRRRADRHRRPARATPTARVPADGAYTYTVRADRRRRQHRPALAGHAA